MIDKPEVRVTCWGVAPTDPGATLALKYLAKDGVLQALERAPEGNRSHYIATIKMHDAPGETIVLGSYYLKPLSGSLWDFYWSTHPELWFDYNDSRYDTKRCVIAWLTKQFPYNAVLHVTDWGKVGYVSGDQLENMVAQTKVTGTWNNGRCFGAVIQFTFFFTKLELLELTTT